MGFAMVSGARLDVRAHDRRWTHGIAIVTFDLPGEPVNKLTAALRDEFEALLDPARDDPSIRAAVLISGKPDTFIAGADIEEFTALTTRARRSG